MKIHYLKHLICLFQILAFIAGISGCKETSRQYSEITENDVLAMMDEVGKATLTKDLDGVIKHMAPFVVINITMASDNSTFMPQRVQISRDQYAEELRNFFAKRSYHDYRIENAEITISEHRRSAMTEADIFEVTVMDEKETRTTTHQKSVLEIIDGKILVTSIDAVIFTSE
jgi:hypothetical protein